MIGGIWQTVFMIIDLEGCEQKNFKRINTEMEVYQDIKKILLMKFLFYL